MRYLEIENDIVTVKSLPYHLSLKQDTKILYYEKLQNHFCQKQLPLHFRCILLVTHSKLKAAVV